MPTFRAPSWTASNSSSVSTSNDEQLGENGPASSRQSSPVGQRENPVRLLEMDFQYSDPSAERQGSGDEHYSGSNRFTNTRSEDADPDQESSDAGTSYYYSNSDEDDESRNNEPDPWTLQFPIYGLIALRRAIKQDLDPWDVQRWQKYQLDHERAFKYGPLRDVNTSFREVDLEKGMSHATRMARINDGEPISPTAKPRVEQMNLKEYRDAFGVGRDGRSWDEEGEAVEAGTAHDGGADLPFEFLDCTYIPRFSAPLAEGTFLVNPFEIWSSSAGVVEHGTRQEWWGFC